MALVQRAALRNSKTGDHPDLTNFFIDTEFAETGGQPIPTIDLISIGMISETGDEFYAESSEFNIDNCDDWVKKNVLTKLGPPEKRIKRSEIALQLRAFLGAEPVVYGYYCSYDWVVFCWLFGKMVDLPKGYPMRCRDLQQTWVDLGRPADVKPPSPKDAHNALADAIWTKTFYDNLKAYEDKNSGRP